MYTVKGTVRGGTVVLDEPNGFVEGQRVDVVAEEHPSIGMDEKDWPTTPEGVAALVARMESRTPGWLSPEDEARWRGELQKQKERDIANETAEAEKFRRMWE